MMAEEPTDSLEAGSSTAEKGRTGDTSRAMGRVDGDSGRGPSRVVCMASSMVLESSARACEAVQDLSFAETGLESLTIIRVFIHLSGDYVMMVALVTLGPSATRSSSVLGFVRNGAWNEPTNKHMETDRRERAGPAVTQAEFYIDYYTTKGAGPL